MNLQLLIDKFVSTKIAAATNGTDSWSVGMCYLLKIENFLEISDSDEIREAVKSITDFSVAMSVLYDMFSRHMGNEIAPLLCYYFSHKITRQSYLSIHKSQIHQIRSIILFGKLNSFGNLFYFAYNSPLGDYRGHLTQDEFIDILLLGEVYQANEEEREIDIEQMAIINRQVPVVAANHPSLTKAQVIKESILANKALFNVIRPMFEQL